MNGELRISVIVTVYNVSDYLEECIASILKQTYRNLEIILVDDGSTDESGKICDLFAQHDKRIRVFHTKNQGLIAARKYGISLASGDLVAYVDGDDWIDEKYYANLVQFYQQHHADVILSGCIKEAKDKKVFLSNNLEEGYYDKDRLQEEVYPRMLYYDGFFCFGVQQYLWNKLYKREILKKWQLRVDNSIKNGEDVACLFPLLLDAKSIEITNIYGYHYRIHDKSMTGKINENFPYNNEKLFGYLDAVFTEGKYTNLMKRQLVMYYTYITMMTTKYLFGMTYTVAFQYDYKFPFEKVPLGSKILLLAQGKMGQEYYFQLQRSCLCDLVKCIWMERDSTEDLLNEISNIAEMVDIVVIGSEEILKNEERLDKFRRSLGQIGNRLKILYVKAGVEDNEKIFI